MCTCREGCIYQQLSRRNRHQVHTLQLSRVGQEPFGGGPEDLVAHGHQLTALKDKDQRQNSGLLQQEMLYKKKKSQA